MAPNTLSASPSAPAVGPVTPSDTPAGSSSGGMSAAGSETTTATRLPSGPDPLDPEIQRIIDRARGLPTGPPARISFAFCGISALMLWASFTPLDFAPLAWLSLVPLVALIRSPARPRWLYVAATLCGVLQAVVQLQWMRLGHPTMYVAWLALAGYVGLYWPVFCGLSRVAVHRLRVPLVLTVPVVWAGLEYLREFLMTGFGWYHLGHSQYRWLELIQISDITGARGVSFLVALSSAAIVAALPVRWLNRLLRMPAGIPQTATDSTPRRVAAVLTAVVLTAAALGYGTWRRNTVTFTAGPRVALVQGNFTTQVKHNPGEAQRIFQQHHLLTGLAVREQPDLILWPETMYRSPLLLASPDLSDEQLSELSPVPPEAWRTSRTAEAMGLLARQSGAAMVIGVDAFTIDVRNGFQHFNSAAFLRPDVGLVARYDKQHRVPFGEYLPLREELPWLHKLTPYPPEFGIARGHRPVVFDDGRWRYAPVICFEDTVPSVVRDAAAASDPATTETAETPARQAGVDCLLNLTNDGWFHGSSELDQHLITSVFRAVECRTLLARAVNTGISAIIDGDGAIVEPDKLIDGDAADRAAAGLPPRTGMREAGSGRFHRQFNGVLVHTVPLDPRTSLYVRWGDWFGNLCLAACGLIVLAGTVLRFTAKWHRTGPAAAA